MESITAILFYGMLFNHSYIHRMTSFLRIIHLTSMLIKIKAGEEILINYNGEVDNDELLWFDKEKEENEK